jgi:hypothetical protein
VSQILVKERGWQPEGPSIPMHDLNGRSFHCYGVHQLSIRVCDAFGKVCCRGEMKDSELLVFEKLGGKLSIYIGLIPCHRRASGLNVRNL